MSGQNPREIAVHVLAQRAGAGRTPGGANREFVEAILEKALSTAQLSGPNRHLCQELVFGIVRWQATLDWLISRKTAGRVQKTGLQNLLRLGLYQIFWLDRIPAHAAVHETVELARHSGFGPQSGFVNAVLRGYLREFDGTKALLVELRVKEPAIGYSHPSWLAERWIQRWGPEQAGRLMAWNNTPPGIFARVNTLKIDPGKLLETWREEGVEYDFVQHDWFEPNLAFALRLHPPLLSLASFQQGFFYIQDPSTLLAPGLLKAQSGHTCLDLCAAPGGKLTYIAQLVGNQGRLVACDTDPSRLELVKENCTRLGVTCAEPVSLDELDPRGWSFDSVLVDAPCSNTGVMRRRVELRWRIRPEEIERLQATQLGLLQKAASLVKTGGTVVYSTCSLEPEENRQVVQRFLVERPGFNLVTERELLPFVEQVDGAYAAALKRIT